MKNVRWIIAAVLLLALAWTSWMGFVNTRTTLIEFVVAGSIAEVEVFKSTDPAHPVARLTTGGAELRQKVEVRNTVAYSFLVQNAPAQYFFTARTAGASFQGGPVCCTSGVTLTPNTITVTIRGPNDWDQVGP